MSIGESIRHELREIGLVSAYFFACFLVFLCLKQLLLAEYDIRIAVVGTALVSALVVAKVVVLFGKSRVGDRFSSGPPIVHVLWRTLAYTALVFLVTLGEHVFRHYRETGSFDGAVRAAIEAETLNHFLAMNLAVAVSLFLYNLFAEVQRHLGGRTVREILFARERG